jgi:uncharacterized coiled-coil DUF342 family protein
MDIVEDLRWFVANTQDPKDFRWEKMTRAANEIETLRNELRDISQAINMDELDLTMTASECIMKLHAEIDELREYKKCVGPDYYDCATKLNAALKEIGELKNEGETLLEMFRVANQTIERMGDQHDAAMKEIERLNIIISGKTFC